MAPNIPKLMRNDEPFARLNERLRKNESGSIGAVERRSATRGRRRACPAPCPGP